MWITNNFGQQMKGEGSNQVVRRVRLLTGSETVGIAVLIDPEKIAQQSTSRLLKLAEQSKVDFIFVGGSSASQKQLQSAIDFIRKRSKLSLIIFPGSEEQIDGKADALLLLSLVSGRNPELLIGAHVRAAKQLQASRLELIPTAYLLIDQKNHTAVQRVSQTAPLQADDEELIVATCLASEQLGMSAIYLEAGSGAAHPVPPKTIKAVKENCKNPLIVGGGIDSLEKFKQAAEAGADLIVIGNALESHADLLLEFEHYRSHHKIQQSQNA